ncbi:MAG: excinuclease ABC subunit UvrC [Tissierellia bacterium]|nr:excinuclease ABC subunit UvrC [Tissierellia bacterium]
MFKIKEELTKLPAKPGVYLMYDKDDEIIYVGKAKKLNRRVRQYFDGRKNKDKKVVAMVKHIVRFEYILVNNEVEALVLESNLIKENRPKYNILLRDDKQYPYIKITNEPFPRVMKVRRILKDGAKYYGPFPNAYAVNDIIDLFHQIYKLRNCNLDFSKDQYLQRPCLNFFIDRCPAPCIKNCTEEEYEEELKYVRAFLDGKYPEFVDNIRQRMEKASKNLNFELAAEYRDALQSIDTLLEKQMVSNTDHIDLDLIAMARREEKICVQVFMMRNGKIVEREHFMMEDSYEEGDEEVMASFIQQFYLDLTYVPKLILLDTPAKSTKALEQMLSEKRGSKVELRVPQRGDKVDLMKLARENASEMLLKDVQKNLRRDRNKQIAIEDLEKLIGVFPIERIECYDISNIAGTQSTGSMIVFENGVKQPREYRKFKIKSVQGPDDYRSQKEILTRRFNRGLREREEGNTRHGFGKFPSLIMMDGGKGQVNIALDVLRSLNIDIPVIGLVKDDKHNTRGIIYENKEYPLKVRTAVYRLLYQIQEEAHRFAIGYHRKLRQKAMVHSELDDIKGIGEKRRRALLNEFKSIDKIKKADLSTLEKVPSMNKKAARSVYDYFRGKAEEEDEKS